MCRGTKALRFPCEGQSFRADSQVRDNVQIGGVWTPPELRGRGYARRVVAGALRVAEGEGVRRAVLFTENPAARRSYEALGFRQVGEFGVIVLAT